MQKMDYRRIVVCHVRSELVTEEIIVVLFYSEAKKGIDQQRVYLKSDKAVVIFITNSLEQEARMNSYLYFSGEINIC